jgi:restriction endonuclease Mrr
MALMSGDLAEKAGLTEEEQTQLREKAAEIRAKIEKQAVEELLKELPPAKLAKIKQLAGKEFNFVEEPPRFGFGGDRGDRGGRDEQEGDRGPAGRRRGN